MIKTIFLLSLIFLPSHLFAEKRSYECAAGGSGGSININFSVKDGAILDKVSGKFTFSSSGFTSNFNGTYNPVLDVFLAYIQSNKDAKKKAVTGRWEEDDDIFYLNIKVSKKLNVDFVCPRKKKKSDLLTGVWVINDASFFSVQLNEGFDGAITGNGMGSFSSYTLSGLRTNDGDVTLELSSPDGTDNTSYTMKLCGSGSTMTGTSDSTISPSTIMCRKNRAISQECQPDSTC